MLRPLFLVCCMVEPYWCGTLEVNMFPWKISNLSVLEMSLTGATHEGVKEMDLIQTPPPRPIRNEEVRESPAW